MNSDGPRRALRLSVGGFLLLVLLAVLTGLVRGDSDRPDPAAAKVLFSVLGLLAVGLMAAGGVIAWRELRAEPPESGRGQLAFRAAVGVSGALPLLVLALVLLDAADAYRGDSEAFLGIWLLAAVVVAVLGGSAPEPGHRGLLVIPLIIGTGAIVLVLSEALGFS